MSVVFSRVEERLIHGQVTCAWAKFIDFDAFVVVDDVVAKDEFMSGLLEMSVPSGKKLYIFDEKTAIEKLGAMKQKLFLLAKSPVTFANLVKAGIKLDKLNIGSVHMKPGKKEIYRTVYLSDAEIGALRELMAAGVPCEIQKLPTESGKNVKELI